MKSKRPIPLHESEKQPPGIDAVFFAAGLALGAFSCLAIVSLALHC